MRYMIDQWLGYENNIEICENESILTGDIDLTFKGISITAGKLPFEVRRPQLALALVTHAPSIPSLFQI